MRKQLVIPAQTGIQRAKRKSKIWTPAFAGVTRIALLVGLMAACLFALPATEGRAAPPGDIGAALQHEPIFTPVLVWRDCQRIAMCSGCRPVFKCRSCSYRRTCAGGICGWGDVCVWGPYMKVLPRGARIVR